MTKAGDAGHAGSGAALAHPLPLLSDQPSHVVDVAASGVEPPVPLRSDSAVLIVVTAGEAVTRLP